MKKKNIPKPIIKIGHSTKNNGEISFDIDGNKLLQMNHEHFEVLISNIDMIKMKALSIRNGNLRGQSLDVEQYNNVISLIKSDKKLSAAKMYKIITGCGLKEAKDTILNIEKELKNKLL